MSRAARVAGPLARGLVLAIVATTDPRHVHAQPVTPPAVVPSTAASIVLDLPNVSALDRGRVSSAAAEAIARLTEWLGPGPAKTITIAAAAWRRPVSASSSTVVLDVPMRSAPETMDLESQVAFGVARMWWPGLMSNAEGAALTDALAWYLQSRIVEPLYDLNYHVPGHSATGVRYFGGAWPWTFSVLPLDRESGGLGREEYLRSRWSRPSWLAPARRLPPRFTHATLQGGLAIATLEKLVGWPALQGALRVSSERSRQGPVTRSQAEQTIASAAGQDLSWFFHAAFNESTRFDYAIHDLTMSEATTTCGNTPCVRTRVTVERKGNGEFTGRSGEPPSGQESGLDLGDAIELRITFANGQQTTIRWDGRAASRTLEFESATPAVLARIDPDRVVMLDENALNNDWRREPRTKAAVGKWVAYWMVWLQGAMLDYGVFF